MFKLKQRSQIEKLKGFFSLPIPFVERAPLGNWSPWFGKYENQRWNEWDSDSCWCLSTINCIEDQLEWLWKNGQFNQQAKDFFTGNGYIDADGDFSLSERFIEIMSGFRQDGGSSAQALNFIKRYGILPRALLNYSGERADKWFSNEDFVLDYFNRGEVTQGMLDMAQQSLNYISLAFQAIRKDKDSLRASLRMSPIIIGIPIPSGNGWNTTSVIYDGSTAPVHAVELYGIAADGTYLIFDQYQPNLKTLSANYLIPLATQGVIYAIPQATPNPINQGSVNVQVWKSVYNFFAYDVWGWLKGIRYRETSRVNPQ